MNRRLRSSCRDSQENSSKSSQGFNRRSFLGTLAATGLGSALLSNADGAPAFADDAQTPEKTEKFAASFPLLQNVTADGATVSWALAGPATGWVEWGPTPALGKIARNSELGLNPFEDEFVSARMTGLAPNTQYFYRTATAGFAYQSAYDKAAQEPEFSDVYSFKTIGPNAETAAFVVMNDTHNTIPTIAAHVARADELNPDFIVWNGDICSDYMNAKRPQTAVANPTGTPYAAERPLVFVAGNHDKRGSWVRNLKKCFTLWPQDDARFGGLGYNFAFRQGPLAVVGLDTGEDKPDWHPAWSGMANFDPYRELQAAWLDKALSRPEIQNAPFLVAFCHIPLYDANSKANPGNILDQYADFQWPASRLWGPIFEKYGVQLLVAAHQHRFSFAEPTADRSWAQIVGGGPEMKGATCIHAEANAAELKLTCEKLADKTILGTWSFKPRG